MTDMYVRMNDMLLKGGIKAETTATTLIFNRYCLLPKNSSVQVISFGLALFLVAGMYKYQYLLFFFSSKVVDTYE